VCSFSPNACSVVRRLRVAAGGRVLGEDRRPGEPEQVVPPERLGDGGVHVAELGAVALVEDDDDVPVVDVVGLVARDERRELLDRGDDDRALGVSELRFSTAVDVFEFAAPFSKRSYSSMVW
jgi:hypothetical protein